MTPEELDRLLGSLPTGSILTFTPELQDGESPPKRHCPDIF